jgi:hypothetical protein
MLLRLLVSFAMVRQMTMNRLLMGSDDYNHLLFFRR